ASATYHQKVSTVRTGRSPLSVALSSLSPVVAVANYGDHTLSIYATRNADASLQRIVPDVALPGDMAAVQTAGNAYGIDSQVAGVVRVYLVGRVRDGDVFVVPVGLLVRPPVPRRAPDRRPRRGAAG